MLHCERPPRTDPRAPPLDRNPGSPAEAASPDQAERVGPGPFAHIARTRRQLHGKPERVTVSSERPPVRATHVGTPDRAIPAAAQVALHLVLTGIIGQLAELPTYGVPSSRRFCCRVIGPTRCRDDYTAQGGRRTGGSPGVPRPGARSSAPPEPTRPTTPPLLSTVTGDVRADQALPTCRQPQ